MNKNIHLNLFKHYSEISLENNLTRALVITLQNDPLFLNEFFYKITNKRLEEELSYDSEIEMNIQEFVLNLKGFEKLYAITLTTEEITFLLKEQRETKNPITDIAIIINNIGIIIEVKPSNENCEAQLRNQVDKIVKNLLLEEPPIYKSITWGEIISLLEKTLLVHKNLENNSFISRNFMNFMEINHPTWFPIKKFSDIPFSREDKNFHLILKRLKEIKKYLVGSDQLIQISDRFAIPVNENWASEINMGVNSESEVIDLKIWPGDTKGQGISLFEENKTFDFFELNGMIGKLQGIEFTYKIGQYLKFSHFQKGMFWVFFDDYKKFNRENFNLLSGRWRKDRWEEFYKLMERMFPEQWKDLSNISNWNKFVINSNRTTFDLSMGIEFIISIDYKKIQKLEKEDRLIGFLRELIDKMLLDIKK